ncbi:TetR/AcrR family transcriptional regulator [Faecalicatena acetigenes]|uniref:TetR/AcrR family transcriptional regulator n=1 Tax=Faecalicatena acetigenes TaxID=2981790 RepID=A0ABT2TAI4_9FIRM|nr:MULTISPECIES: TetR/AcrR family transcriptional regulator [Lachnospiraceae]MCU6746991.1 TetR/AcrR family transcriptional regulator [Faecalicatena acetigenes]SCH57568.1 Toluene efflux pump ttgABC operon repressor [uncultured Clostridium sp.]
MDKEEKKKSVKTRIVSAAWQLFYEKGYDQTTVDDIIALSGTSKGSFYYYFSTKDELLGTLSNVLDDFYEELAARMEPSMNSFDKLLYLNEKAHEMIEKKIPLDLLTSLYSTQLTFKGNRHLLDKNRVYYQLITEIAEEGQKRGEIRTDKPVSEIVRYYSLCERALITDWCLNQGSYSLHAYTKEYMPVMLAYFRQKSEEA